VLAVPTAQDGGEAEAWVSFTRFLLFEGETPLWPTARKPKNSASKKGMGLKKDKR